jgi:hypothetical protein
MRRHRRGHGRQRVADGGVAIAEQLGNAEVEQLDLAVAIDQHIVGLEIAMHDQIAVGELHRGAQLLKQLHASAAIETLLDHMTDDGRAIDVFHGDVRRAVGVLAAINELRDVRMAQAREQASLQLQTLAYGSVAEGLAEALDCQQMGEISIAALAQEHRAHAALAESTQHREGSDAGGHGRFQRMRRARNRGAQRIVVGCGGTQHRAQPRRQLGRLDFDPGEQRRARRRVAVQCLVEQVIESTESSPAHVLPCSAVASQARAMRKSRLAVAADTASTCANSASLKPPK